MENVSARHHGTEGRELQGDRSPDLRSRRSSLAGSIPTGYLPHSINDSGRNSGAYTVLALSEFDGKR
jgi:hypothetical protein